MATATWPEPGTKYGPCLDEACGHRDCDSTREEVTKLCRICFKEIGYGNPWFTDRTVRDTNPNGLPCPVHADCLYEELDKKPWVPEGVLGAPIEE